MLQIVFADFEIAAAQKYANLAELEKCCQTHIFLQNFVLIQPRTSLPKICKVLLIFPILLNLAEGLGQLLVVADRELDVAGGDPLLLPVPGSVASELEGLRNEVLENLQRKTSIGVAKK